jgi:hypothetical protein
MLADIVFDRGEQVVDFVSRAMNVGRFPILLVFFARPLGKKVLNHQSGYTIEP